MQTQRRFFIVVETWREMNCEWFWLSCGERDGTTRGSRRYKAVMGSVVHGERWREENLY